MTVLFMKDWAEQGALPDWDTKNQSFVELAGLYKNMSVENYAFMLALHDQNLKGVDPYDPDITPDNAIRVAVECKLNFWYWVREIARDPAGTPEFPILFRANRGVIAAYWLFFNHAMTILIMIRQTGKSFGIDWLVMWLLNIGLTRSDLSYITKDDKLRGRELERLKSMELVLPTYLKQRSSKDPGNTEVLRIGALGNAFKPVVPNRSPKLADLIGRGMTAPIAIGDEFAYLANNHITIPVMLSATLAAREVSRMKNEPYGTIFMTTSGKRDTAEGRYAYNFMQAAAIWTEKFFDCRDLADLENHIKKAGNGKDVRVNCTFNHRQLGQTDQWLRDRLRESAQEDPVAIRADYLNEWPSGTMSSPFTAEVAEMMRNSERLDYYTEIAEPEAYALRWYYPDDQIRKMMEQPHVLGMDPSEAVGRDAIGFHLRNAITGETAMAADVSEGNLIAFCRWLASFLQKYPSVTLNIERKNTGAMIIDFLLEYLPSIGINPFRRIYNQIVQFREEYPDRFMEIQNPTASRENIYLKYKKYFGWSTSATGLTSRSELFSRTLSSAAKMTGRQMADRKLILQTLGLEIRNGRVDHSEGEHDDLCFIGSTLVRTDKGNRPISELKVGDLVLTRQGYKPILKIFCSEKEVISKFGLTGTPNHPFITPIGEVKFENLTPESGVYTWDEKQSCIMEKSITDILNQTMPTSGTTFIDTIKTMNLPFRFIAKYGKITMDLFLKGWRSTTKTMISRITLRGILNVLHLKNTENGTLCLKKDVPQTVKLPKGITILQNGEKEILRRRAMSVLRMARKAKLSRTGKKTIQNSLKRHTRKPGEKAVLLALAPKRLMNGEKTTRKPLKLLLMKMVTEVKLHCKTGMLTTQERQQTAYESGEKTILSWLEKHISRLVKKQQKQEKPKKQLVYNLHVADCHEYFANDILVHNCFSWLLSYWLLSSGKNLSFYGIDSSQILSANPTHLEQRKTVSAYDQNQADQARKNVELLSEQLKNEADEYVARRLEYDLERAISQLTDSDRRIVAVDDLINKLRKERARNVRRRQGSTDDAYSGNYRAETFGQAIGYGYQYSGSSPYGQREITYNV